MEPCNSPKIKSLKNNNFKSISNSKEAYKSMFKSTEFFSNKLSYPLGFSNVTSFISDKEIKPASFNILKPNFAVDDEIINSLKLLSHCDDFPHKLGLSPFCMR